MLSAFESEQSRGPRTAFSPAMPTLPQAILADLSRRLASGAVLWDLRPLHEVQRAPLQGAVNLGQVDWVIDDWASERLQVPSVISKILARAGIYPGTAVILYAGDRRESLTLARRALNSIGVTDIAVATNSVGARPDVARASEAARPAAVSAVAPIAVTALPSLSLGPA